MLEEHGKQLVRYSDEKEPSAIKKKSKELANRRIEEMQDLNKQIDFSNLIYYYKGNTAPKMFVSYNDPLRLFKNIKQGNITLEKAGEEQKEFKSKLNKIVKGRKKSEEQIGAINNIKKLYESRGVIKLFEQYYRIISKAKYKIKYGESLKILTPKTPKQVLKRLPIALAQV